MLVPVETAAGGRKFSPDFQQMCSMVAVAKVGDRNEILQQLILQLIIGLPDEQFRAAAQIAETTSILFGITVAPFEVQQNLETLVTAKQLYSQPDGRLSIIPEVGAILVQRIQQAATLEEAVKRAWLEEISRKYSGLPHAELFKALKAYIGRAFRRHGVQAIALLDPTVDLETDHVISLSRLLSDSVEENMPRDHRTYGRAAISDFFATAGQDADRAKYIAQLADGAFNYFSLAVAPEVAAGFRHRLSPLKLFLDTNFIFGILKLHVNPQVEVSNELLRAIGKFDFPFTLLYHAATYEELNASISYYADQLRNHVVTRMLSRAAATSRYLSGIELRYYKEHAETGIDVDTFLMPYKHIDELLSARNIDLFRPTEERTQERSELINEYKAYLELRHRSKSYNLLNHDATVLDTARLLRSQANSSLEAGTLCITCDYSLYSFDLYECRKFGRLTTMVLPNLFWQILRSFVPADEDFDKSFAATFALPEFRVIGSGAAAAGTKMLHILATYKDLPEETAARMLSNDLLIDQLRVIQNNEELQAQIEAAIVKENATLIEEKAVLAMELEAEKAEKTSILQQQETTQLEQQASAVKAKEELEYTKRLVHEKSEELEQKVGGAVLEKIREHEARTVAERRAEEAERRLGEAVQEANKAKERASFMLAVIATSLLSVSAIGVFEWLTFRLPWTWLVQHPNSYGLQASFDLLLVGCCTSPARNSLLIGRLSGNVGYPPLEERNHARPQAKTGQTET